MYITFFSCVQRREQCQTEDCVKILCPELAEIKSVEHECQCVLYWVESHAVVTNDIIGWWVEGQWRHDRMFKL